jgi:Uma2 family endonuclease
LGNWTKSNRVGAATDSSTGYILPNGAIRSPDAAWISHERLATVPLEQRRKFLPLCPDFLVEIRSPTDDLKVLEAKMEEYIDNGARLGLLIDPETRCVHAYRPNQPVETTNNANSVSCDPELPGFVLYLNDIWEPEI